MDFLTTLKALAPTVASAVLGPLGPVAIAAIGSVLGVSDATQQKLSEALKVNGLTPEQITEIKRLELEYQNNEAERGFKYAELEFKDRDSARNANTVGGVQKHIFYLTCLLLTFCIGTEIAVMVLGLPVQVEAVVAGRILGLLDSITLLVLTYHYGSSSSSKSKTELLAQQRVSS